jgi:hypothetical protein
VLIGHSTILQLTALIPLAITVFITMVERIISSGTELPFNGFKEPLDMEHTMPPGLPVRDTMNVTLYITIPELMTKTIARGRFMTDVSGMAI